MEQDPLRYCGIFDLVWNESSEFATLLVKNCLSGVANRKSVIIPPSKIIKKISKMSGEEQKTALMNYILSRAKSVDDLERSNKVLTIGGKEYVVRTEGGKVYLNDVAISLLKVHKERSIFKAENELSPQSIGGACGAAKFSEDEGTDIEEEIIGIEEEETTDEEDTTESSSSSEEEEEKKPKKKKKVGGASKKKKKKKVTSKKKKTTKKKSIKGGQSSKKKTSLKYIPF